MAAPVGELRPKGRASLVRGIVAAARQPSAEITPNAFEFGVEDEVHHACNRIGAIGGRRTACYDIHALDEQVGEGVDIGPPFLDSRDNPPTIEQGQHTALPEAAKVEKSPGGELGCHKCRWPARSPELRHLRQAIRKRCWRSENQLVSADHSHRCCGGAAVRYSPRAGHYHFNIIGRRLDTGYGSSRWCRLTKHRSKWQCRSAQQQRCTQICHVVPQVRLPAFPRTDFCG